MTSPDSVERSIRNVEYRASGGAIIPYKICKLTEFSLPQIEEVVLGPKNNTPLHVVEEILAKNGFSSVQVKKSLATYR